MLFKPIFLNSVYRVSARLKWGTKCKSLLSLVLGLMKLKDIFRSAAECFSSSSTFQHESDLTSQTKSGQNEKCLPLRNHSHNLQTDSFLMDTEFLESPSDRELSTDIITNSFQRGPSVSGYHIQEKGSVIMFYYEI